jgi:hypothetical protein
MRRGCLGSSKMLASTCFPPSSSLSISEVIVVSCVVVVPALRVELYLEPEFDVETFDNDREEIVLDARSLELVGEAF